MHKKVLLTLRLTMNSNFLCREAIPVRLFVPKSRPSLRRQVTGEPTIREIDWHGVFQSLIRQGLALKKYRVNHVLSGRFYPLSSNRGIVTSHRGSGQGHLSPAKTTLQQYIRIQDGLSV